MSNTTQVQIGVIKELIDTLAELGLPPLFLVVNVTTTGDTRPDIGLWMQTRTDFERLCAHLKAAGHERPTKRGARYWFAEHDTLDRRLLIQVASFPHHDDWQERTQCDS